MSGIFGATISGEGSSNCVNQVTGLYGTVGGGDNNTASGYAAAGSYSFVVGRRAKNTNAAHTGVFMFADSTGSYFFFEAADKSAAGFGWLAAVDGRGSSHEGVAASRSDYLDPAQRPCAEGEPHRY